MTTPMTLVRSLDETKVPLSALIRIFLGGYFIYSGIVKVGDPIGFLKAVHLYEVLPATPPIFLNSTAIALPWLEIFCGAALVLGFWARGAALTIAIMLAVFTPAILMRGLAIGAEEGIPFFEVKFDCGCGTGVEITWIKLCKNGGLFLAAAAALLSQSTLFSLPNWLDRHRSQTA